MISFEDSVIHHRNHWNSLSSVNSLLIKELKNIELFDNSFIDLPSIDSIISTIPITNNIINDNNNNNNEMENQNKSLLSQLHSLQIEKADWNNWHHNQINNLKATYDLELKKLTREKLLLHKNHLANSILPSKKDRIEIEALKSKLSDITNSFKSKEIKLNSTIDRLTRKVADLERKLNDATMEIRVLEDHRAKDLESRQKLVSDYEHKIENLQKLIHKNSYTLNEIEGNSSLTSQSNRFKLTSMQDIKRDLSVYGSDDGFGKKRSVQSNLLNNGKVSTLTGQKKNGVTIKANGMDSKTTGINSKGMTSKLELSMKSHIKDVKRQSNDVKDITKDVETSMYNSKESKSGSNKQIYQLNGKGNNCGYESKDLEPLERYPNHQSPNQRQSIYAEAYKRSDSPKETNHLNTKPGLKIGQSNSPHFEKNPSLLKKPSRITISNVETDHLKQTIDVQDRDDYHSSKEDLDRLESRLELDTCVEEYVYSKDGKHERKYQNGTKLSWLPNGTMKMYHPDNIIVIYYSNGDSKTTFPDERVMYWYNATKTQHTSFKDGYELFEFENGQVEKYFPDGIHLVEFPDGITKTVYPDKTEEIRFGNGKIHINEPSGRKVILMPDQTREVFEDGIRSKWYPNGIVKHVYPNGYQETRWPNGQVRIKNEMGVVVSMVPATDTVVEPLV